MDKAVKTGKIFDHVESTPILLVSSWVLRQGGEGKLLATSSHAGELKYI